MRSACFSTIIIALCFLANSIAHGQENLEPQEAICRGMYSSAELCYHIGKVEGLATCISIAHSATQAMIEETGDQFLLLTEEACLIGCTTAQGMDPALAFSKVVSYDRFKEVICP